MGTPTMSIYRKEGTSTASDDISTMRLGYADRWGSVISVNATAYKVKESLMSIDLINGDLEVTRKALRNSRNEVIGHEYTLVFPHSADWSTPFSSDRGLMEVVQMAYGPMKEVKAEVMSGDASISVLIRQHGHADFDMLVAEVYADPLELMQSWKAPVATVSIPIYVLPVFDPPQITIGSDETTLELMEDDNSTVLRSIGIDCPDCASRGDINATVQIICHLGTLQLVHLSDVENSVHYEYDDGVLRLVGVITDLRVAIR